MRLTFSRIMRTAAVLVSFLAMAACGARDRDAEAAITAVMKQTWDKPDLPLEVGPIAVESTSAIADWTQGSMGGRALLQRRDSTWSVVLCAGDGVKSATVLQSAGLSAAQAQAIVAELAGKEKTVPAERLAAMTAFKGLVRMHASPSGAHMRRPGTRLLTTRVST